MLATSSYAVAAALTQATGSCTEVDCDNECCTAADYFLEHDDAAKGVDLLLNARQASRALDICEQRNLTITEVWHMSSHLLIFLRTVCFCTSGSAM